MIDSAIKIISYIQTLPQVTQVVLFAAFFTGCLFLYLMRDQLLSGYTPDIKKLVGALLGKNDWSDIFQKNTVNNEYLRLMMAEKKSLIIWNTDTVTITDKNVFRKNLFAEIKLQRELHQPLILNLVAIKRANSNFWDVITEVVEDVTENNNLNLLVVCPCESVASERMNVFYNRVKDRIENIQTETVGIKRDERYSKR